MISIFFCTKIWDLNVLSVEACLTAVVGHLSHWAQLGDSLATPSIPTLFFSWTKQGLIWVVFSQGNYQLLVLCTCMYGVYIYPRSSSTTELAEQAPGDASVDAKVMKAIKDWKNALLKFIFNLFNKFFITIWSCSYHKALQRSLGCLWFGQHRVNDFALAWLLFEVQTCSVLPYWQNWQAKKVASAVLLVHGGTTAWWLSRGIFDANANSNFLI